MLQQGPNFISVASLLGKYRKSVFLLLRMVFGIEHIFPYSMLLIYPQPDVRFLSDHNSWSVNGTPNLRTVK